MRILAWIAVLAGAAAPSMAQSQPTLDPNLIPKYADPLVIPPVMPKTAVLSSPAGPIDYYEIGVRQIQQQILPAGFASTPVFAYGLVQQPGTFNYPAFTIDVEYDRQVRVNWINQLVDSDGRFLPHLLAVDQTIHWANPPGPDPDTMGMDPTPYRGPVPIVTHVHGIKTFDDSDGYAEAWYLPTATDVGTYITKGSFYDFFAGQYAARTGTAWAPGSATFQYSNRQPATTLWYHDHVIGMTRLNVYAGMAGFYLIRGGPADLLVESDSLPRIPGQSQPVLPGPAPAGGDPAQVIYHEIPLAVQDKSFNADGTLFYPDSREFFDGFEGPYAPDSDIAPIWNPEFFGNAMLVNGKTWPTLDVEARRYRFRVLNGCNSRFLILKLITGDAAQRPAESAALFWQIGAEQGFLRRPVALETLLMAPAERADVIVDFTGLEPGSELYMINEGPDEPFGGGVPGIDFPYADPMTTGQVMKFRVVAPTGPDLSTEPARIRLPRPERHPGPAQVRRLALLEEDSMVLPDVGPRAALLGTIDPETGEVTPHLWHEPITETIRVGDVEVWEIHNFTVDAHPIHIHLVRFEVLDRRPMMDGDEMLMDGDAVMERMVRKPEPWESGLKDTFIAYPGEITRVRARFDIPGRFVWHCHIVEHEDNEMMRPFEVIP